MTQSRNNGRRFAVPAIGGSLAALLILSSCGREAASPVAPEVGVLTHSVQSDREKDRGKDKKLTLSVEISGRGDGQVKSTPQGIDCDHDCRENFAPGTVVVLTATAEAGSAFLGWTGPCAGTSTCTVTLDADKRVTATFTRLPRFDVTVTLAGNGTGFVTSSPRGIACGGTGRHGGDDEHGNRGRDHDHGDRGRGDDHRGDCRDTFFQGTVVTLTANATGGSAFAGWSGACSGTNPTCTFTVTADASVTATFSNSVPLTVVKAGTGTGTVTSAPAGIDCGATCSAPFMAASTVVLTAVADAGSVFSGWSGACTGTGACSVTLSTAATVTATFQKLYTLTVSKSGTGTGTVSSSPAGIDCGATCSGSFASTTTVVLTAVAAPGSVFVAWSGACTGSGSCSVPMGADASVSAQFDILRYPVTVTMASSGAGTGGGTVVATNSGSDPGFSCATGSCSGSFVALTTTTLTATPDANSAFVGFSGAGCSGSSTTCVLPMDAAKSVTATFQSSVVTVTIDGEGGVLSSPSGVSCAIGTCSASFGAYGPNALVTLTASPGVGKVFDGWTGDCAAAGLSTTCNLTVDGAKSATARFIAGGGGPVPKYKLTVSIEGSGAVSAEVGATVIGSCAGDGESCGFPNIDEGTVVTLTATPDAGFAFTGWSGACSGASLTCTVTMTAAKSVTALFEPAVATMTVDQSKTLSAFLAQYR